jgi:hypothetical protein
MQAGELSGDDAVVSTEGNASSHATQVWKIQPTSLPFMGNSGLKMVFYGNFVSLLEIWCHFMEILCHLWKLSVIIWKFCVTYGNFVSQG